MSAPPAPDGDAVAELVDRLARALAVADATALAVAAVAGGEISDDGAPLGLCARPDVPGVEAVTVTRRWNSDVPNAAEIHLAPGLSRADVEARLGSGRPLRRSAGADRVVLEGPSDHATTTASFDAAGSVRSIAVRRDI